MKWNEQMIYDGILEVAEAVGEGRMPTHAEVIAYCGNHRLASQITNRGGYAAWAQKLGLPLKASKYNFGIAFEKYTHGLMQGRGYDVIHTGKQCPYDLLINKKVKIEVKASRLVEFVDHMAYTFHIAENLPKCDIYIAHCVDDNDNIVKTYIIPAHKLTGKSQLTIGEHKSKYDIYIDQWDMIDKYDSMLTRLDVS